MMFKYSTDSMVSHVRDKVLSPDQQCYCLLKYTEAICVAPEEKGM